MSIIDLFDRIVLVFGRTFNLVIEGAVGDLALWDIGIIVITILVILCVLALFREPLEPIHIGQEWVLEQIHKALEWILDLVHGALKRIQELIRIALKR